MPVLIADRHLLPLDFSGEFIRAMDAQAFVSASFPPTDLKNSIGLLVNRHSKLLLSVNGFDCVLLNEALQRFQIEPQRSTNLDAGKLPQPGFLVDRVHFEAKVLGRLPDIQEPPTDESI
jgi:hypothetical protein